MDLGISLLAVAAIFTSLHALENLLILILRFDELRLLWYGKREEKSLSDHIQLSNPALNLSLSTLIFFFPRPL